MELKVIAIARNGHTDKFGIPRQSREESPILTRIVFEPEYNVREALRGIEGYSHLWLIWGFSEVPSDKEPVTKNQVRKNGLRRFVRRGWEEISGWVFLRRGVRFDPIR